MLPLRTYGDCRMPRTIDTDKPDRQRVEPLIASWQDQRPRRA
jgi:hypothetical protein